MGTRSIFVAVLVATACGPASPPPSGGTRTTRDTILFHQDTYEDRLGGASLDLVLDGAQTGPEGVSFGRDTFGIVEGVEPGMHDFLLVNDFDGSTVHHATVETFGSGTMFWLAGNESRGGLSLISGPAWAATPAVGNGVVRAVHSSTMLGAMDVYVVPRGGSIAGATPVFADVAVHSATAFAELPAGDVTAIITAAGTTTVVGQVDVRVDPRFSQTLAATENCQTQACASTRVIAVGGTCLLDDALGYHCFAE